MSLAAPLVVLCAVVLGLRWLLKRASVKAEDVIDEEGELVGEALPAVNPDVHDATPLSSAANMDADRARTSGRGHF